ncbi:alkaline phosphatase [Congregibacter litoralis]|uniref:Alkaline phosphatase n=1 Tax=Congregibacter litoralis KT71 TaxID=314285 RepID=A4ABL4_9GAMM|nr:alkaline phosphatase [Congregibacter litoralis]EAQ96527.1 alkaline phosphatase [Congregibacter litoralis KT71]
MIRASYPLTLSLLLTGCMNITVVESDTSDTQSTSRSAVATVGTSPIPDYQRESPWYTDAQSRVASAPAKERGQAKNVVLFLGDGMGISTITAARILQGQKAGNPGEENRLSFENFPVTGLVKTYNVDSQTPDSAGTMSAIMTGVKTKIGVFGVDERVIQEDCQSSQGIELLSLLEIAELAGKATGVVSTARMTHATPAATYAKTAARDWEDDGELPEDAKTQGCKDIAAQFLASREGLNAQFGAALSDGIEVALGGGRQHFLPASEDGGRRTDGRNLIKEWQTAHPEGRYVGNKSELKNARQAPLLGLFSNSHMAYALERDVPGAEQPTLPEMTLKALELLQADGEGFLLVVEAGRIDHAHHAGNAANALEDTIELSEAVAAVMRNTNADDTLVMVTADHSHVFTMAGYPRRGNPILGKVVPAWSEEPALDVDGQPYTTLGYMNGRGYRDHGDQLNADSTYAEAPAAGRRDISDVDTTRPGYHQEALVPLNAETHGGEDVAVYAKGPGAEGAMGAIEQNQLFHVMLQATTWEAEAAERIESLKDLR